MKSYMSFSSRIQPLGECVVYKNSDKGFLVVVELIISLLNALFACCIKKLM